MVRRFGLAQRDFFELTSPPIVLEPADRAKTLDRLQALLLEAMATPTPCVEGRDRSEGDDDEDHL